MVNLIPNVEWNRAILCNPPYPKMTMNCAWCGEETSLTRSEENKWFCSHCMATAILTNQPEWFNQSQSSPNDVGFAWEKMGTDAKEIDLL